MHSHIAGLDRFLTTDPREGDGEVPQRLRCTKCKRFLSKKPDKAVEYEDALECDGSVTLVPEEYTEGMVGILGEAFRGRIYYNEYSVCGQTIGKHEPHSEVQMVYVRETRVCKACRTENVLEGTDY